MARKGNLQRAIDDAIHVAETPVADGRTLEFAFRVTKSCREEIVRAAVYRLRSKHRLARRNCGDRRKRLANDST